jgi:hypothetical protein
MENVIVQNKPSLKTRLFIAVPLLLFFLAVYFVVYSIGVEMSTWGGTYPYKEDLSRPDRLYLVVIWPIIMFITAIVPPVFVLLKKRAVWWITLSIAGMILSFVSGWGWLFILEITHK